MFPRIRPAAPVRDAPAIAAEEIPRHAARLGANELSDAVVIMVCLVVSICFVVPKANVSQYAPPIRTSLDVSYVYVHQ